ncbi:MAG: hypothetical protein ACREPX_01940 [Rhodanobacteraceae bacterium]
MNFSEFNALAREFSGPSREMLEKYLPVLLAILIAWLFARGLRKMFWTAFGLYWAFGWMFPLRHFLH